MIGVKRNVNRELPYSVHRPLSRVELHVHLDGAVRHETIWDLAKQKGLGLPGRGSLRELKNYLVVKKPVSLADFLSRFDIIADSIRGDLTALERIAYEFVEDSSREGIAYFEARFCPHLIYPANMKTDSGNKDWAWKITGAIIKGLEKGQVDFCTKGNLIITCIRNNHPNWYTEAIELAADQNFHRGRIVGIDIAGVADHVGFGDSAGETHMESELAIKFCQDATKLGISRTIHAGESGSANSITIALDKLQANRIGHGYRSVDNKDVYERIKNKNIHLETCPWSSILTASVCPTELPHPIVQFFQENFNVSVNTDDPTVTGTTLDDEFRLLYSWGLTEAHFIKASFNAARSSFLPENEKSNLIEQLSKNVGCTL